MLLCVPTGRQPGASPTGFAAPAPPHGPAQPYQLTKSETVQLINTRPGSVVELFLVGAAAGCCWVLMAGCCWVLLLLMMMNAYDDDAWVWLGSAWGRQSPRARPREARALQPTRRCAACRRLPAAPQCIEDCEERLDEQQIEALLQLVAEHLRAQ